MEVAVAREQQPQQFLSLMLLMNFNFFLLVVGKMASTSLNDLSDTEILAPKELRKSFRGSFTQDTES